MKYIIDNDLHIHSGLSSCSNDPGMTPKAILDYALSNGLKNICLTDHFWDETADAPPSNWYRQQDYAHIAQALPLPKADGVNFMFGCEIDMDAAMNIGLRRENFDRFDFVIIPTTHLHMNGFTCRGDENAAERAALWVKRFDALLDMDLPFRKVGVAHLTCQLVNRTGYVETLDLIPDSEYERLFAKAAKCGIGIELNFGSLKLDGHERDAVLKPYKIAKKCGCKFYFGSDAHHPEALESAKANFENISELLELEESDKFIVGK